jgi:ubiquinone/menaquinone biosynthesis C-methylase UbiE
MRRTHALPDDTRRWQLDLAAARCYQQFMVPVVFQPWATKLVDRAGLCRACRVLDLACGTGVTARIAAERVGPEGEVVALDLSAPMLEVARSLEPVAGARIRWQRGDAEDLPFSHPAFDAVLCQQGFQFFPNRLSAALEIARVLRPHGRLALSVWCGPDRNPMAAALIAVLRNSGRPAFSRAMRWPFSVQNRREITAPIKRAGFRVLTAEMACLRIRAVNATAFVRGLLRSMPFAGEIVGPDTEVLVRDTISALRAYVRQGELRVPWQTHTIVAVRATEHSHQHQRSRQ